MIILHIHTQTLTQPRANDSLPLSPSCSLRFSQAKPCRRHTWCPLWPVVHTESMKDAVTPDSFKMLQYPYCLVDSPLLFAMKLLSYTSPVLFAASAYARTFTVYNACPFTIWWVLIFLLFVSLLLNYRLGQLCVRFIRLTTCFLRLTLLLDIHRPQRR